MKPRTALSGWRQFFWIGWLALGSLPASAATWYVATNGSDAAAGTLAAPFRSINHALQQAVSGDVVEVRGGAYQDTSEVRFRRPGITLRSYSNEWARLVAPLNNENDFSSCVWVDADAKGTVLSRLEIQGGYYYGVVLQTKWDWGDPADRSGASGVIIQDCVIHDTGRDAIKITPNCDDVVIERCEIYRSGIGPANQHAQNAEGIDCVNSDRLTVRDCVIRDAFSTGIYLKGGATDGLIERTRVERCGAGGILLGFDTSPEFFDVEANPSYYENIRGTVRNCLVRDTAWEGIGIYAASNPVVFNNTLLNVCTDAVHSAIYFGLSYQDWEPEAGRPATVLPQIYNNLVIQPAGFDDEMVEIRYADELGGLSALQGWPAMDYNLYFVAGGGQPWFTDRRPGTELERGTLAQWRAHSGADAHSRVANPLALGGEHPLLLLGSPGLNAGTNAAWMAGVTDLVGQPRILGGQVDIGAYETGTNDWAQLIIGHAALAAATNPPPAAAARVGQLRWFFTHASVGGNLITGLNGLYQENAARYPLQMYNYDGQNGDGDYHGAVPTAGTSDAPDYRAAAVPSVTANGRIYECQRGNPSWENKLVCFSNSVVQSGWRFPKVNVALDKFCWIDPAADPAAYCATMAGLAARYPQTLLVYMTMPLTTETAGSENDARNDFNRYVRAFCRTTGAWLLDLADITAWTAAGSEQTYVAGGVTNQRLVAAYAVDAGSGDFHLNATGRRRGALGWHALAQALFQTDRDGDGVTDGDELIAGTVPTDPDSFLALVQDTGGAGERVLRWAGVTNRWYNVQESTALGTNSAWVTRAAHLPAAAINLHTVAVTEASSFWRLTVEQ